MIDLFNISHRLKEAAYSIYTDIKHRTQFLVNENVKKIKDLDVDIELNSIYLIVPYQGSSSEYFYFHIEFI